MKMNEIIRERRLKKGLTQEQMANYLGVSAPAVNKWEKGTTYPDIVLLPVLARLLDTDLNTLLSFQEDLSEKEIALFLNYLSDLSEKEGIERIFEVALDKIKQFPNCYPLILNVAILLEGILVMKVTTKKKEEYEHTIEDLYRRALESPDIAIQNQTKAMLISKYRNRKEYDLAQEMLDTLPNKDFFDKKQLQISLWTESGKLDAAVKLAEEQLLMMTNDMHFLLMSLMEIAIKEERNEDAEYIAEVYKKAANLFGLWEYTSYVAHFQLYAATKQRMKAAKLLIPMLKSLTKKWELNQSPLYQHLESKEVDQTFGPTLQKTLVQSICEDKEIEFLKDSPELQEWIKENL